MKYCDALGLRWLCCLCCHAWAAVTLLSQCVDIPFTLNKSNNICINAVLNEVDSVTLMFHTAAASLAMTKGGCALASSITFDDSASISSWGGQVAARYSSRNSLEIYGLRWDSLVITEDLHSGPNTHGKFGWNLFQDKIIEIDYQRRLMRLHERLPSLDSQYEKLTVVIEGSLIFVEIAMEIAGKLIDNRYLIHSGFGGTLLLDDDFADVHRISELLPVIGERTLKDSMGNTLKTKKMKLTRLRLGSTELRDIPIGIFEGAIRKQKMSVLGADILRRFNLVLDTRNRNIYLKPNENMEVAYPE